MLMYSHGKEFQNALKIDIRETYKYFFSLFFFFEQGLVRNFLSSYALPTHIL